MKKYGRTYHLPISPGATSDDKIMSSIEHLQVSDLVITEKMDGENTTIHRNGTHARSPDSKYHPSRDWLQAFAAGISFNLAPNERIVGENLYARHSIAYTELPSYFLGFALIVDNEIQSWSETLSRFSDLGIAPVKTLYRGAFYDGLFEEIARNLDQNTQEGFVVRSANAFLESQMPTHIGKYVRAGHVQSEVHWTKTELVPNSLKN
ncbi:RNA ligase family protein [Shimia sp. R9_2]|uniref:RNA ligase family protein n=1 Tax=Shimia sp. R9_2 TaxID=2821112 RepID=UPI001ADB244F|nr:RNA ligase family protein [Shimia sp. R9_2]MBO9397311.1 RNA ligase family protein [Shimia sp. R9_2]